MFKIKLVLFFFLGDIDDVTCMWSSQNLSLSKVSEQHIILMESDWFAVTGALLTFIFKTLKSNWALEEKHWVNSLLNGSYHRNFSNFKQKLGAI